MRRIEDLNLRIQSLIWQKKLKLFHKRKKDETFRQIADQDFSDGADMEVILELYRNPHIKGFTTTPTLMGKSGITDYEKLSKEVLEHIKDRPISFKVFFDNFDEMEYQARKISTWGKNVYVKIPITNTKRESSLLVVTYIFCAPTFWQSNPLTTAYLGVKNRLKLAKCSEFCNLPTCG
jgi:hypothetical protein